MTSLDALAAAVAAHSDAVAAERTAHAARRQVDTTRKQVYTRSMKNFFKHFFKKPTTTTVPPPPPPSEGDLALQLLNSWRHRANVQDVFRILKKAASLTREEVLLLSLSDQGSTAKVVVHLSDVRSPTNSDIIVISNNYDSEWDEVQKHLRSFDLPSEVVDGVSYMIQNMVQAVTTKNLVSPSITVELSSAWCSVFGDDEIGIVYERKE